EGAAAAGDAFDPEAAAVELDQPSGEREAESGAFGPLAVRRLFELLEDRLELLWRDAGAGIGDGDFDPAFVEPGGEVYATRGRGELDRVGQEIEDNLAHATPVGSDRDLLRVGRYRELDPGAARPLRVHRDRAAQHLRNRHHREFELHRLGLDLGQV